ncbi:MAG: family 20 glycosylhydrolase [Victivallales bacterium]|nr:family 20 glycosylhydrolase [Victivallales bacterium]
MKTLQLKRNSQLVWQADGLSAELCEALRALRAYYPEIMEAPAGTTGITLHFEALPGEASTCQVARQDNGFNVRYSGLAGALRGVGSALGGVEGDSEAPFTSFGIMLDCSRNRVMTVEHLKGYLAKLALMGYNQALLYCEDTYELPGEPLFGYMRGAYSEAELREIDDFAALLGIEIIGCIELLGHGNQFLKWWHYADIKDTGEVMLIDEPKTYEFIDKAIAMWGRALRSRRIHIGMDEAHDMGRGRYWDLHGVADHFELFNRHLDKVNQICQNHGLKAMIWSDMYFRIADRENHGYYHDLPIPAEVAAKIPRDVQLVYWDYYHEDKETYLKMIQHHRDMGCEPPLGSGVWTWSPMFWYNKGRTDRTAIPGLAAAREAKLKEVFFTMWGDDGAMCDYDSALAGLAHCADVAYCGENVAKEETARRFQAVCGANYEGVQLAAELQDRAFRFRNPKGEFMEAPAGLLFFDDPLLGIGMETFKAAVGDSNVEEKMLVAMKALQRHLRHFHSTASGDFPNFNNFLRAMILKVELRKRLTTAYDAKDKRELRRIAASGVKELQAALAEFAQSARRQWLATTKPFGVEVVDSRIATLSARLDTLALRITDYLAGRVDKLEELEARRDLSGLVEVPWSVGRVQTATNYR